MKIAFVGKGGSGKSTLTALFIRYLQNIGRNILAIDADLNMSLAELLATNFPSERHLASANVAETIRKFLIGANHRIASIEMFMPTTLPGSGSNILSKHNEQSIKSAWHELNPQTSLMTVGSYDESGTGQTCYHSHLFVVENILSHSYTKDFDIVCDMVAGTDAFAYSMHLQFDALVLICEPTPESVNVCQHYFRLARCAGIADNLHLVLNKIEDQADLDFIKCHLKINSIGQVPHKTEIKKLRQIKKTISLESLEPSIHQLYKDINSKANNPSLTETQRYQLIHKLHKNLNSKQWVKLAYGDISNQIDTAFSFDNTAI